jgi:hypothetical protein
MANHPAGETPVEALRRTVQLLTESYERTRAELAREIEQFHTGLALQPEDMRDNHGRYILLDALTALVQANTVLANADRR